MYATYGFVCTQKPFLTRNIGVREILWDPPLVYLELQRIHFIDVTRHSENKAQELQ